MDHRLLLTLLLGLLLVKGEEEASVETVPDDVETVGGVWGRVRDPESPIVHLQGLGSLRGGQAHARSGPAYFQFLGVPYAAPPVMALRFKPPAPALAWQGVREATTFAPKCPQNPPGGKLEGSEDCLYLNVFARHLNPEAKRPVIVYIHGGAFTYGQVNTATGQYMMEQDMVLVTLHYRLGPLGFLTTEDSAAPGNVGLHDQVAALRWVQTHIAQFGGDPALVTVVGMSAGGASVNYLQLSPQTDGLFQRAAALSGSALCWWANIPNQAKTAKALAEALSCPTSPSSALLDCLRGKKIEELMAAESSLYPWHPGTVEKEPMTIWSPRSDPEAGDSAILPISPHLAMEAGQIQPVPFLIGVAETEGAWRAGNLLTRDAAMEEFINKFRDVAPLALGLNDQVNEADAKDVLAKIRDFYLGALTNEKDLEKRLDKVVSGMVNMLGDSMFNYPIDRMVKMQGNKEFTPTWMYVYNYKHEHALTYLDVNGEKKTPELDLLKRATHANELSMMFPLLENILGPLSEEEVVASRKYIKFLFEFAVRGHPKQDGKYEFQDWLPVMNGQLSHFFFGKYAGSQKGLPFQHRMKWWNELPAYWKRPHPQPAEGERYAAGVEEISEDEINSIAEELTKEELEELEVVRVAGHMKEEL